MISVVKQLYPSTSPIAIWGPRWLPSRCQVMPAIPVWPPRTYDKKSDWRIRQVMTRLVNNPYIYIHHISFIYLSYIYHIVYIHMYIYIYIQGICYKRCFYLQRYMVQNGQNFSQSIWRKDDGRCVRGTNWELGGYNYGNYGL